MRYIHSRNPTIGLITDTEIYAIEINALKEPFLGILADNYNIVSVHARIGIPVGKRDFDRRLRPFFNDQLRILAKLRLADCLLQLLFRIGNWYWSLATPATFYNLT